MKRCLSAASEAQVVVCGEVIKLAFGRSGPSFMTREPLRTVLNLDIESTVCLALESSGKIFQLLLKAAASSNRCSCRQEGLESLVYRD